MNLFLLRLAARTLLRRPARSILTLGSIALGVAALTFLGSIMVGVNDAMIANSISLHVGNAVVRADDAKALVDRWRYRADPGDEISAVLPRVLSTAMLSTESGAASVQLVGVLPEREEQVSAVPARLVDGRYLSPDAGHLEIVVGDRAARSLAVGPGQTATMHRVDGSQVPATVVGIFHTGIERFDESFAYVPLDRMSPFDPKTARGEVALFFQKGARWKDMKGRIEGLLIEGETVVPWEELLPELEQLLRLNVVSMFIVIVLVVIMMAAGVSNTVLVSVMDRYREFGVLKALGTTPGEVVRLVLMETALICLIAGTVGFAVGSGIAVVTSKTGIDLGRFTSENIHFVLSNVVHPRLTWGMAFAPALTVLATGLIASLWPAAIAGRRRAADVLRLSA